MTTLSSITRLPYVAPNRKEAGVDQVDRAGLAPISTALPLPEATPDRLLLLSRKFARSSRDENAAMDGCRDDGLD